jgi:hypothetical protein
MPLSFTLYLAYLYIDDSQGTQVAVSFEVFYYDRGSLR